MVYLILGCTALGSLLFGAIPASTITPSTITMILIVVGVLFGANLTMTITKMIIKKGKLPKYLRDYVTLKEGGANSCVAPGSAPGLELKARKK